MSGPLIFSRRRFLQQAGAFSALSLAGSLDKLGLAAASAQTSNYKALVCVFLFGGNDANSMIIPGTNYADYAAVRTAATGVQVPQATLLPISPLNTPGLSFGLHPAFTSTNGNPTLQQLFNFGVLAPVMNCGTLVEPLTRAEYRAGSKKRPDNLFSHSDQQQQGMTSISQASALTGITGWGGRLADRVVGLNAPGATPMSMSFSGSQTFGTAVQVRTLALPTSGNFGFSGDVAGAAPGSVAYERAAARTAIITGVETNAIVAASQGTSTVALNSSVRLNPAIALAPPEVINPFLNLNTGLANQLRAVAKMIYARSSLGHSRQIFFVSIGGFDTHTGQGTTDPAQGGLPGLYQQIGQALSAFYTATVNMGVAASVTTFTVSDFSRTFKPNGAGTDHAWGGHAFVLGASVVGQRLYGTMPSLALGGADDTDTSGRWIPTTSVEQVGATLGRWFGVADADLAQVFPNLNRFATSNLGFMG